MLDTNREVQKDIQNYYIYFILDFIQYVFFSCFTNNQRGMVKKTSRNSKIMLQNFFFWTKRLLGVRKDKCTFSVTHVLHIRHSLWQVNLDLLFFFSWNFFFFFFLSLCISQCLFEISAQKKFVCVLLVSDDPNTYLTFVQTKQKKTELGCYFRKLI